jgi:hypothetical protein
VAVNLRTEGNLEDDYRFAFPLFLFWEQKIGWIELLEVVGNIGNLAPESVNRIGIDSGNRAIVPNA